MSGPSLSDFYKTSPSGTVVQDKSYERARRIAEHGTAKERASLAQEGDVPPEVLYYLANDAAKEVRQAVAGNDATPTQADLLLAEDKEDDVRGSVGSKLERILPSLSGAESARVTKMVFQVAEVLAQDRLPTVRALIAQQVKALPDVPHDLVMTLARDAEAIVSVPVLEFSPLLKEEDLVGLVTTGINSEALAAVARRENLTESVSHAIVETRDDLAVPALLANRTAEIGQNTMEAIVEAGDQHPSWHQALVQRDGMSKDLVVKIAAYASERLVEQLIDRNRDLDSGTADLLRQSVRNRMQDLEMAWDRNDPEVVRAEIFNRDGKLNAGTLTLAAGRGEETFVIHALSIMTGFSDQSVRMALQGGDGPKAAVAIAWKTKLGMDFAVVLQTDLLRLPGETILQAQDGGAYPLSATEMQSLLDLLK